MARHADDTDAQARAASRDHGSTALRLERSPKRVRALVSGRPVLDSRAAMLIWEKPYYPTYYVPRTDVLAELRTSSQGHGRVVHADLGPGRAMDLRVAGETRAGAVLTFPEAPDPLLRELVRPRWDAMEEWLEEDEPVYVHPRDPYKRIDVLASTRHVRVVVDGVTVADSRQPRILFETGLPPRYYLPVCDVGINLLRPTDTVSHCPYKGTASWWRLQLDGSRHDDIAWMYRLPTAESQKIAGLLAFYDERVDLDLDGEPQPRPVTPFA